MADSPPQIARAFDVSQTFRLRKSLRYLMPFMAVFFLAALIGMICVALFDETGKVKVVALVLMSLGVWGTMFILSIYGWIACYVERLTIDGTQISFRSMLQSHQFDVSELESVKWSILPRSGCIVFRCPDRKSRLYFSNYSREDRLKIIETLQDLVPESIQEGWPEFCYKVALPLRDGRSFRPQVPPTQAITVTRNRYDRMASVCIPASIAVAVVCWVWFDLWQLWALPPMVVGSWLLLRFVVPPSGLEEKRLAATVGGSIQLIWFGFLACGLLLAIILEPLGLAGSTIGLVIVWAFCGVFGLSCLIVLPHAIKKERIANEQAAVLAPEEWRRGLDREDAVEPP